MAETVKLTVEKCRQICAEFRLTTKADGKKGCIRLINQEMCSLPSHFRCELVRFKEGVARKEKTSEVVISASRVGTIERCPRAYHLHYAHGIGSEEEAAWKRMGDAWGVARARLDTGLPVDVEEGLRADLLPYEAAKVRASIRLYRHDWVSRYVGYSPGEVNCEIEALFEDNDLWWLGFIDAMSKDHRRIWEWKYAVTDYDMLSVARQAAIYLKAFPEAQEFTLATFRKPGQRPGKEETVQAFENRIAGEMTKKPEEWIRKFTFARDQLNIDGVLRDTAESFRSQFEAGVSSGWAPHYSACYDCDYRSICAEHIGTPTATLVQIRKKADSAK